MMLAYNPTWIASLVISRTAKRWMESGILLPEQYASIKTAHATALYSPNLFVRIALYIFTSICVSGVVGLVGLVFSVAGADALTGLFLVLGIGAIVVLEVLIKQKHLYCAGIDDALLYSGLGLMIGGVLGMVFLNKSDWPAILPALVALPFLVAASVRYADTLTTLASYMCLLFIICQPLTEMGPVKAYLPLVVMVVSAIAYAGAVIVGRKNSFQSWETCFAVLEIASLVTFYLGGNYFIVRQFTDLLLQFQIPEGTDIPLAFLFYGLTVVVPIAYIVAGILRRDSILLRVGLLAAAFSVFTFRFYFHIAPPEVALTIGGIILIGAAFIAIKYLKIPKKGFTHERLLTRRLENLDTEMLVVSNTLGATAQQPQDQFKGGGGTFGGGGSTGNW